jgi:hypothetical protein
MSSKYKYWDRVATERNDASYCMVLEIARPALSTLSAPGNQMPPRNICTAATRKRSRRAHNVSIILVVEHDSALIEDALSEGGFQPAIGSAEEAVTLLQAGRTNYRALVIDVSPDRGINVNGWKQLAKRDRSILISHHLHSRRCRQ